MTVRIMDKEAWQEKYMTIAQIQNTCELEEALQQLDTIGKEAGLTYLTPLPPMKNLASFANLINQFGIYDNGSQIKMQIPSEVGLQFGELPLVWKIIRWLQNHPTDIEYMRKHMQKIKARIDANANRDWEETLQTMPYYCDESKRIPL